MKILNKPIEVIAHFGINEYPVPILFRVSETVVKISSVISAYRANTAGVAAYIFDCMGEVNAVECRFTLKYVIDRCKWYIYKK